MTEVKSKSGRKSKAMTAIEAELEVIQDEIKLLISEHDQLWIKIQAKNEAIDLLNRVIKAGNKEE